MVGQMAASLELVECGYNKVQKIDEKEEPQDVVIFETTSKSFPGRLFGSTIIVSHPVVRLYKSGNIEFVDKKLEGVVGASFGNHIEWNFGSIVFIAFPYIQIHRQEGPPKDVKWSFWHFEPKDAFAFVEAVNNHMKELGRLSPKLLSKHCQDEEQEELGRFSLDLSKYLDDNFEQIIFQSKIKRSYNCDMIDFLMTKCLLYLAIIGIVGGPFWVIIFGRHDYGNGCLLLQLLLILCALIICWGTCCGLYYPSTLYIFRNGDVGVGRSMFGCINSKEYQMIWKFRHVGEAYRVNASFSHNNKK